MKTTWIDTDLSKLIKTIESGGRPEGGVSEDSGEIPSLGGENIIQTGGVDVKIVKKIPTAYFERMKKGILEDHDVLINKDGANTGKVGLYTKSFPKAAINEHLFLIRGDDEKLSQDYLYYLLLSEDGQQKIRTKITGSAQPGLKQDFIKDFLVFIPNLKAEQKAITDVLTSIDQAISQTKALIAKQKRVKTGMMQDLLTRGIDEKGEIRDPSTHKFRPSPLGLIPVEWECVPLGTITTKIADRDHRTPIYVSTGVKMISPIDFYGENGIDFECAKLVTLNEHHLNSKKTNIEPFDIILHRIGAGLGRVRIVLPEMPEFSILHSLAMVKPNHEKVDAYYLLWAFRSLLVQTQMGTGIQSIGVPDLGLDKIGNLLFLKPKKPEQKNISKVLNSIEATLTELSSKINKLNEIKNGLMEDLLSGKVSVESILEDGGKYDYLK